MTSREPTPSRVDINAGGSGRAGGVVTSSMVSGKGCVAGLQDEIRILARAFYTIRAP